MKAIFVLTAVKIYEGSEDTLGFYSSEEKAKDAAARLAEKWEDYVLDITEQPVY